MAQHEEIVLWLDRRWKNAIEKHLKGETLQEHLETVLDELCNRLPEREYERISRAIQSEAAAQRAEEEAARTYAAYSYLPKPVKSQVDAIVDRLAQLPEVAACYDQWWQLKDEIAGYYGRNTPPRQPLTQRKEFRSLKNWIIREAEDISFSPSADSTEPEEKQSAEKTPPIRGSVDVQLVGETVSARHIPANAVMRLLHHMGQIFRTSTPVIPPALRIDSKRRRRLQEKRMAMGHKRDDHEDEQLRHVNENTM